MASSLEELLAKEGFRGGKLRMRSRASFRAETASMRHVQGQINTDSPLGALPSDHSGASRRARDNLVRREKLDAMSKTENWERLGRSGSDNAREGRAPRINPSEDVEGNEIVEVGPEEDERFKDIYSDKAYGSERIRKSSKENRDKGLYGSRSDKNLLKHATISEKIKKSMKNPEMSYESSVRSSRSAKSFDDARRQQHENAAPTDSRLALDEVAIKAVISILNGYIKRFFKDEEFRITLHQNCFSSLNFKETAENNSIGSKVITSLEEAIIIAEKAAEGAVSAKDLEKASLQLSMITGLKSNDLKDGYTSGIPNSRLSACAHVYLSIIYKLQKKDRISAKHLLQVFCDSPFWARTVLLAELWDYLFFPHLSHLKLWHDREADSLLNSPSKIRKLKLLDKVYNEILDSGTYQFSVYYKEWLTEGIEAPSLPSISIPSLSVQGVQHWDLQDYASRLGSPSSSFSPHPMVSKKLYDSVIGRTRKPGVNEYEDDAVTNGFDNGMSSSDGSAVEVKQTLADSVDHGLLSAFEEDRKLVKASISPERDPNDEISNADIEQETARNTRTMNLASHTEANKLTLKSMAKSVFENKGPDDRTAFELSHFSETFKSWASYEELRGRREHSAEESLFASAPQDFICPLTGKLFNDPVTLETGQTFEGEAIKEWFNKGHRTCPVTGKTLNCANVPVTNFILKRIIDNWKSKHCNHLLAFACQMVRNSVAHKPRQKDGTALLLVEMLLTTFCGEERLKNAKQLMSLGGLKFLIRMFEFGNAEEKARTAALLSTCIEAEAGCRNQIAGSIDKKCLLDLLHCNQSNARKDAVFLLTELVCLRRRKDVTLFLSDLQSEEIMKTMHSLLIYLQSSPPEQRPSVAVLLLNLDLLVEPRKFSIYREEAVDALSMALEDSLTNDKVRERSCKALLIMGARFSSSGKLLTESWMLKQAGFHNDCPLNSQEDDLSLDSQADEEEASEEWLRNLSISLLGSGKKSFLESISKCLRSGNIDLVRACLTTIAWLSYALSSLSDAEFQLPAFSVLIPGLKTTLENGEHMEHKVLASMSLLNFSQIPECRVLLKTISEEIAVPLRNLAQVTWTAKQLHSMVFGD